MVGAKRPPDSEIPNPLGEFGYFSFFFPPSRSVWAVLGPLEWCATGPNEGKLLAFSAGIFPGSRAAKMGSSTNPGGKDKLWTSGIARWIWDGPPDRNSAQLLSTVFKRSANYVS